MFSKFNVVSANIPVMSALPFGTPPVKKEFKTYIIIQDCLHNKSNISLKFSDNSFEIHCMKILTIILYS